MDSSFKDYQAWFFCWLIFGLLVCNTSSEDRLSIRPTITAAPFLEDIHQALKSSRTGTIALSVLGFGRLAVRGARFAFL
ncbi:uncharacterized protein K444DRAFT_613132 [Hyaloscypha bicolor E]|uniref:Uncharacterized protein n=1 Tax=Hyaloscypha bicolor E TaxID=1095630 RepID=A0A2J6T999_9HELO|nr:uncharacterized protein K444DRAFT_613132 [Hyaloscypha bicolor E]PMD59533.1 hypothetical protein K444DRAFT_613132 [Hyaloscypha bicolor E]